MDRRRPAGRTTPPAQGGVALLIVLVVLFIVAVLVVDITLTATTARRSARNASSEFLMDAAIEGHFQVAAAQIVFDGRANQTDSLDDRWAREEYTTFESTAEEEDPWADEYGGEEEDEGAPRVLGDSTEVSTTVRIEDEERKFNLNLLLHPDPKKAAEAGERFAVLIDRFREETPLDISRTRAEDLRDRVVDYLRRATPAEGEEGKVPLPKAGTWRILTPDELRNIDSFEEIARGLGLRPEGILYDAREPEEVRAWNRDPEGQEPPEVYPGLLRYVTLWSGTAWTGQADPDSWLKININTAEKPVLETLFWRNPSDYTFVERILEYREALREGEEDTGGEAVDVDDPLPLHQTFENIDDLKEVEGIDDGVLQRNGIDGTTATVRSGTFSVDVLARRDRAYKQVRYVIRRNSRGFTTLLREERADPRYEDEEPEPGTDE